MQKKPTSFDEWQENVHPSIKNDPLWEFQVYSKALFAYDLVWADCDYLLKDERGKTIAKQLKQNNSFEVLVQLVRISKKVMDVAMEKTTHIGYALPKAKHENPGVGTGAVASLSQATFSTIALDYLTKL